MKKFFKSVSHALSGIRHFLAYDRNGRIEAFIALVTIVLGFVFSLSSIQWIIILLCIAAVISLEMINSAIENLCDLVSKETLPSVRLIKDLSAGAVLVASVLSAIIGLIIYIPYIIDFFKTPQ